jgi:predicted CoA-binding protein
MFWQVNRYAVVGESKHAAFPLLTYRALKAIGKTIYAVDPAGQTVDGDHAYADLKQLPGPVDALVLEVPRQRTRDWVARAADVGITRVWIHMKRDTPEALALANEQGMLVCTGTCAVQYLRGGFPHNVHRMLRKLAGKW